MKVDLLLKLSDSVYCLQGIQSRLVVSHFSLLLVAFCKTL